jgi:trk system potassium uptake protein TrkA
VRSIVIGCGRTGAQVATAFWQDGQQVTVVDTEPEAFLLLPQDMRELDGVTVLGDGTQADVLIRAGIKSCEVFVAVTGGDNRNAFIAQKAKRIFGVPRCVCCVGDLVRQELYEDLGLIAISPTKITSSLIIDVVRD